MRLHSPSLPSREALASLGFRPEVRPSRTGLSAIAKIATSPPEIRLRTIFTYVKYGAAIRKKKKRCTDFSFFIRGPNHVAASSTRFRQRLISNAEARVIMHTLRTTKRRRYLAWLVHLASILVACRAKWWVALYRGPGVCTSRRDRTYLTIYRCLTETWLEPRARAQCASPHRVQRNVLFLSLSLFPRLEVAEVSYFGERYREPCISSVTLILWRIRESPRAVKLIVSRLTVSADFFLLGRIVSRLIPFVSSSRWTMLFTVTLFMSARTGIIASWFTGVLKNKTSPRVS